MRILSQIVLLLAITGNLYAQSPHGENFDMSCTDCHNSKSWKLEAGTYTFDHSTTSYPLTGMHQDVDCKSCHPTLVFKDAGNECISCHTDMHNQTVGMDCAECHTPRSWIVNNITEIHQRSRFPLLGPHATADCYECHPSASTLEFEPLGIECYDCHRADYLATTDPNHQESGFSTDCIECHRIDGITWTGTNINHSFFPLTEGHAINDCAACHTNGNYDNTPTDCFACHEGDYTATTNPSHPAADLSTNCSECHTTAPGWSPADFMIHDAQYFPVYSGKHQGEWESCTECHTTTNNYSLFSCIDCHDHNQPDTDEEHDEVNGYIYESIACFECHPTGDADNVFNHASTNFPLTGAHVNTDCLECHAEGYQGTTMFCYDCHTEAYNQTTNPNHIEAGISNECAECHTTDPDWIPALFPNHDEVYPLTGEHLTIDCAECHQTSYSNTPNECAGCHLEAYNQTTNPNHNSLGLTNDCALCHTTDPDWQPALFPVHDDYYALEGAHALISEDCFECHQGNYSTTPNTCYGCHQAEYIATNDPNHQAAQFPTECETCHNQNAWEPATFNHDLQYFPIYSGEHQGEWDQCSDCHSDPTNYAIFQCLTCHPQPDMDDEHQGIPGYVYNSINCLECHPDGGSATGFDHGLTGFPLDGAHLEVDCFSCHEGNYGNTPNTCVSCHLDNYNQTTDPNHIESGFPQECEICHSTEPGWTPANYSGHDDIWPLTGAHTSISCFDCHEGNYTNTPNECVGCHLGDYNQTTDPNHIESGFPQECEVCHTTNPGWSPANYSGHDEIWPLTGAHTSISCYDCHEGSYTNTPNECAGCHLENFNQTTNPDHNELGLTNDCALCHSTDPDWQPATFPVHDEYYVLEGAHVAIANNCYDCHEGNYTSTPNTCYGCHQDDYNATNDPNHQAAQFPTDCELCHTQSGWEPSTFNHDNQYFPIYSGEHEGEWDQCSDCHSDPTNYAIFQCLTCHPQPEMDDEHEGIPGYVYNSINCLECHPDGGSASGFDHTITNFPLEGAHSTIDCFECHQGSYGNTPNECVSCHLENFNQTTNPNHTESGFPQECEICHDTDPGWTPANYTGHDEIFPLTGAHETISCTECHEGNYTSTPNECAGCHIENYNQASNPDHGELGLGNDCALCHTTNPDWQPAAFPVHDDYYVLQGAHSTIANNCNECHEGNYTTTPNTCYGCHQGDYNATNDPNHLSAQFPTDCEACHTQNAWEPSTFDHDGQYFPIYSGEHQGEWGQCVDCHTTPGNFLIFDCINCHSNAHNQSQGNEGCYACHPDGEESVKNFQIKKFR